MPPPKAKPMAALGMLLRRLGLRLISKQLRVDGTRQRVYRLDLDCLKERLELAARYRNRVMERVEGQGEPVPDELIEMMAQAG